MICNDLIGGRWVSVLGLLLLAACGSRAAEQASRQTDTLTTAQEVHRLTREEAEHPFRAIIQGVVTCLLPQHKSLVVQDSTRGIYVDQLSSTLGPAPQVGEKVEIEGVTQPGYFAPIIQARRLTRLGQGRLPEPIQPAWDQLINGSLDTQYVEVQGVVVETDTNGVMTVLTHGGKINAAIVGVTPETMRSWLNALVRVRGCLFAAWEAETHQVKVGEIRFFDPLVNVEEHAPTDVFAIPAKRVGELLLFDPQASALRRVKVSGQIIHARGEEYYLSDGTNGLRFISKAPVRLQPGDLVEVVGFANFNGPSPILREASARKKGSSILAEPKRLMPDELFLGEHDSTLVQVEAELLSTSSSSSGQTFEMQAGLHRFVARLSAPNRFAKSAPPGSRLALTGVYAGRGGNRAAGGEIDSFELLLNSEANINVLSRPSWWTIGRVLWILAGLTVVLVGVLVWVITLKRRVRAQTDIIREKVHHETVLEERTRIAREFHDTLEQALVGIGMQLEAARSLLSTSPVANGPLNILDTARAMVRHSHEEARRSVWNLRTCALERGDLPTALSEMKSQVKNGSPVKIDLEVSGNPCPVPSRIEGHLLRIGQEATTNAIKHAQCKSVRLALRYATHLVRLSIEDDGVGFDSDNATSSEAGHFGLLGMRERAEKIGGTLTILSIPGSGTKINVSVPLAATAPSAYPNG